VEIPAPAAAFHFMLCASMGPPIFIGGNGHQGVAVVGIQEASMGPPIFIGGNAFGSAFFLFVIGALQWGHRFSSVEILTAAAGSNRTPRASMGPPIFIGGNVLWLYGFGVSAPSFNGATDFHRWK